MGRPAFSRHAWHDEHVPQGGIGPLGDFLDMLKFERATRRWFPPGPLRPAVHWTDGPPDGD